jgi:hypothetical protein
MVTTKKPQNQTDNKQLSFHFFKQSALISAVVLNDKAFLIPEPSPQQPKQRGRAFFPIFNELLRGTK